MRMVWYAYELLVAAEWVARVTRQVGQKAGGGRPLGGVVAIGPQRNVQPINLSGQRPLGRNTHSPVCLLDRGSDGEGGIKRKLLLDDVKLTRH